MARKKNEPASVGDNSGSVDSPALKAFIERKALADDIKDVFGEAKGSGFDTKIMRRVLARRKKDRDVVNAEDEIISLYESALGVFG